METSKKFEFVCTEKGTYICKLCNENIPNKGLLNSHVDIHIKERPYACYECQARFKRQEHLHAHLITHIPKRPYACNLCDKSFLYKSSLRSHSQAHKEKRFKCNVCNKAFTFKHALERHEPVHSDEKPFPCTLCYKKYKWKSHLNRHYKETHKLENLPDEETKSPVICEHCNKEFLNETNLKKHMIVHTTEKPYSCFVCTKKFALQASLVSHQRIHTDEKPFACNMCSKQYKSKCHLNTHYRRVHKRERPFPCNVCHNNFPDRSTLKIHMRIHSDERPYSCNVCSKSFRMKGILLRHLTVHTGEKPFTCNVCNKSFVTKNSLIFHNMIHTGEKRYACNPCNVKFRFSQGFRRHMRIHHKAEFEANYSTRKNSRILNSQSRNGVSSVNSSGNSEQWQNSNDDKKVLLVNSLSFSENSKISDADRNLLKSKLFLNEAGSPFKTTKLAAILRKNLNKSIKKEPEENSHKTTLVDSIERSGELEIATSTIEMPDSSNFYDQNIAAESSFREKKEFSNSVKNREIPTSRKFDTMKQRTNSVKIQGTPSPITNFSFVETKEKTYVCTLCKETILYKELLRAHVAVHKNKVESLKENSKSAAYSASSVTAAPITSSLNDQRPKLSVKEFKFLHTKEKTYICLLCKATIYDYHSLGLHVAVHREEGRSSSPPGQIKTPVEADSTSSVSTAQTSLVDTEADSTSSVSTAQSSLVDNPPIEFMGKFKPSLGQVNMHQPIETMEKFRPSLGPVNMRKSVFLSSNLPPRMKMTSNANTASSIPSLPSGNQPNKPRIRFKPPLGTRTDLIRSEVSSSNSPTHHEIPTEADNTSEVSTIKRSPLGDQSNRLIRLKSSQDTDADVNKSEAESSNLPAHKKLPTETDTTSSVIPKQTPSPLDKRPIKPTVSEVKFIHTKDNTYICTLCDKSILNEPSLIAHAAVHTSEGEPANVDDTAMQITSQSDVKPSKPKLNEIKFIHTKDGTYICTLCNRHMFRKRSLRIHATRVHSVQSTRYVCKLCNKIFNYRSSLNRHRLIRHEIEKSYFCESCKRRYASEYSFDNHSCIQSKIQISYSCDVCNKSFAFRHRLNAHKRVHSDWRPYSCSVCNKNFKWKRSAVKHWKNFHLNKRTKVKKMHPCSYCEKIFKAKSSLRSHLIMHSDERPYVCDLCPKTFKWKTHFLQHKRNHSGEKPFACLECNQKFSRKQSLKRHGRVHLKKLFSTFLE